MTITRRNVLTSGGAAAVGLAVAGAVPSLSGVAEASPARPRFGGGRPFPALVDDPAGILALPKGFKYHVVARAGVTLLDGHAGPTPGRQDGTAAFAGPRRHTRLIQNHEITPYTSLHTVPHVKGTVYDAGAPNSGGCTIVDVDAHGQRVGEWVGISGTANNCAGGPTPWGSWLTCEEIYKKAGDSWTGTNGEKGTYAKNHGYVFEVFNAPSNQQNPVPIKAFGRFAHEAVAVGPDRRHVYLTEDASEPNGLFYRWTAPRGVKLGPGVGSQLKPTDGKLEALKIILDDGSVLPDLAYITSAQLGRPFKVQWTAVPDREATDAPIRVQLGSGTSGPQKVTASKKLEGCWSDGKHGVYIVASYAFDVEAGDVPADATKHNGMVWYYRFSDETLTLVTYFPNLAATEADDHTVKYQDLSFDGPDNVHVTPWGSLILAEDGVGASHVLSSTPGGPTYAIARNQLFYDEEYSEFTGPTFSPDGSILFVNIQEPGITLAITGPWGRYLG